MSLFSIFGLGPAWRTHPFEGAEPPSRTARSALGVNSRASAHPPAGPGVQAKRVADILAAHEDLISRIKLCYGANRATFETDLLALIRAYAAFVNLLPATPDNFFREAGGLFRLGLEVAFYALQGTDGHIVSGRATISTRRQLEPRWRHATFIAGLCSELHRTLSHIVVTDERGEAWPAYLGPLSEWLERRRSSHFFIQWMPDTQESRALGLFALPHIVSPATMQHLATANTVAVPQMLSCLAGTALYREQNILADLVKRAAAQVIDRDLIASATRHGRPILGAHLERYLVDAMRRLVVSHPAWAPNHERSRVWYGRDGLFIVWPNAVNEIRKLLEEDELPGIPKAPDTILEILLSAGVLESRRTGSPLWPIEPPPGKSVFDAVKLSAPEILLPAQGQTITPLSMPLVAKAGNVPAPAAWPAPAPLPSDTTDADLHATDDQPADGAIAPGTDLLGDPLTGPAADADSDNRAPEFEPLPTMPAAATAAASPVFRLIAPLRLNPMVRDALVAAIASMNGDSHAADAITVSTGVFVPLDVFKRRHIDIPMVLRSLTETGMSATASNARTGTTQHDIGGKLEPGFVIRPAFVEGLNPSDFAPST
jgi:conjugal transfer pilus assembly protein TraI